jgi:FkbM family methyltransferase
MHLSTRAKQLGRTIRAVAPINWAATSAVRAGLRLTGSQGEALARHLPRSGRVSTRLPDGQWARFWSRGDDNITSQIYWREWHGVEPEQTLLFELMARRARMTIDVGAHVGFYTVIAALANPAGRVYAFEPLERAYKRLATNIALNNLSNVRAHNVAVSDEDGWADFMHPVTASIPSSSSLSHEFMETVGYELTTSSVRTVRLDSFLPRAERAECDLIKLDTESTETSVLLGMADLLSESHRTIFCEVLPAADAAAITRLLRPLGYRFFVLTHQGAEERPEVVAVDRWRNWLFVCALGRGSHLVP